MTLPRRTGFLLTGLLVAMVSQVALDRVALAVAAPRPAAAPRPVPAPDSARTGRNPARPAPEPRPAGTRRRVVLFVDRERPLRELQQALASQLSSTDAVLSVEQVTALPKSPAARFAKVLAGSVDRTVLVTVWCEPSEGGRDFLDVVDAVSQKMLLRPVKDCSSIEGAEEAALIVRTAVDVLLSGGTVGMRPPRTRPRRRPARKARKGPASSGRPRRDSSVDKTQVPFLDGVGALGRDRRRLSAGLAFRLDSLSSEIPADPGGGAVFFVRLEGSWWLQVGLWVASPASRGLEEMSVQVWRYFLEVGAFRRWTWRGWGLALGGGTKVEYRRCEVQAGQGVILGQMNLDDAILSLWGRARLSLQLVSALRLVLYAGMDVPLLGARSYVFEQPSGAEREVFRWWPVQPVSGLGLEVDLL